jgi:glycosyltransferase involved in cell wall biosynthesis
MDRLATPAVSVITIFRDEERFLAEAIESVLAQTLPDWELLLVDDGSTDRSRTIARAYAERRPGQVRYLEHPGHANMGMSASRNLGMVAAKGRYLSFLDGDDVFLPQRLERHVNTLDAMPWVDMVQSDVIHWHSWVAPQEREEEDYIRPAVSQVDRVLRPPLALWTVGVVPELYPGICSLTIRRDAALELGGFEAAFRSLYEDQVFLTKVYASKTVYVIEDYLARYRMHPESTVERAKRSRHEAGGEWQSQEQAFLTWREGYLEDRVASVPLLRQVLDELPQAGRRVPGRELAGAAAWVRASARGLLAALLPRPLYRRALERRRRLARAATLSRYRRLCERVGRTLRLQAADRPSAASDRGGAI